MLFADDLSLMSNNPNHMLTMTMTNYERTKKILHCQHTKV